MGLLDQVKRGPTDEPVRIVLMGQEGVGKTTFVADSGRQKDGTHTTLFLTAEDGGGDLDYARVVIDSWPHLMDAIEELGRDAGPYTSIAIDTIDSFEKLLWRWLVSRTEKATTIEDIGGGYGKGYTAAAEEMSALVAALDRLRTRQRLNVFVLAHTHVKTFNDPMGNPYDRWEMRINGKAAAVLTAWADCHLFACFDVTVKASKRTKKGDSYDTNDPTVKGKAVEGSARRVLYTSKDAAYDAKNRYSLPEEMPLKWPAFADAIRWGSRQRAIVGTAKPAHTPAWRAFRPVEGQAEDPSFAGEAAAKFKAAIATLSIEYEKLEEWTKAMGAGTPAMWPADLRKSLWRDLQNGGRALFEGWLDDHTAAPF